MGGRTAEPVWVQSSALLGTCVCVCMYVLMYIYVLKDYTHDLISLYHRHHVVFGWIAFISLVLNQNLKVLSLCWFSQSFTSLTSSATSANIFRYNSSVCGKVIYIDQESQRPQDPSLSYILVFHFGDFVHRRSLSYVCLPGKAFNFSASSWSYCAYFQFSFTFQMQPSSCALYILFILLRLYWVKLFCRAKNVFFFFFFPWLILPFLTIGTCHLTLTLRTLHNPQKHCSLLQGVSFPSWCP